MISILEIKQHFGTLIIFDNSRHIV